MRTVQSPGHLPLPSSLSSGALFAAIITLLLLPAPSPAQTGPGFALSFNGTNAFAFKADSPYMPVAGDEYTIEAWIKPNHLANQTILGWGTCGVTNAMNALGLRTNGIVNSWWGNDLVYTNTTYTNGWNHVAVTWNAASWRIMYFNGVAVCSNSVAANLIPIQSTIFLGQMGGSNYFEGLIDEVRVWDQARAPLQIQTNRFTGVGGSEAGLKACWKLDEGAGLSAADSDLFGANGLTLTNGPIWVQSTRPAAPEGVTSNALAVTTASARLQANVHPGNLSAKAGFHWGTTPAYGTNTPAITLVSNLPPSRTALQFDGTDDVVIAPALTLTNTSFTVEAWARRSEINSSGILIGQSPAFTSSNSLFFGFSYAPVNTFVFGFYNNDLITTNTYLDTDWHHWAGTYDLATGMRKIYRDGVVVAAGITTGTYIGSGPLHIGETGWSADLFQGAIDEVRVWNVARTEDQIRTDKDRMLAGTETGLLAYWRLEEGAGATTADSSGHGLTATLFNGTLWDFPTHVSSVITNLSPGTTYYYRVGSTNAAGTNLASALSFTTPMLPTDAGCALAFDGTNDFLAFSRPVSNDFTLECWFRTTSTNGSDGAWFVGLGLLGNENLGGRQDFGVSLGNGKIMFGTGGTAADVTLFSGWVADGTWHHLAATRQLSNGDMRLYIDGEPVGQTYNAAGEVLASQPVMSIGRLSPGINYFQGEIDEVRIWNVVRTMSQIQTSLYRPLVGSEAGLLAYFKLDECSGDFAADTTGHGYDSLASGGPSWLTSSVHYGPGATTLAVTNFPVAPAGSATLRANVHPQGFPTLAWFQWGTSVSYGNTTLLTNAGNGTAWVHYTTNISGLVAGTTYHYRVVASNYNGFTYGEDESFWYGLPIVTSLAATDITTNAGTLNSLIAPSGASGRAWFQYGPTTGYGTNTTPQVLPPSSVPLAVTNRLTTLTPGATYHYRIVATNALGTNYGLDLSFTTPFLAPIVAFTGTDWSSLALADYDYDNDLDFVISGYAGGGIGRYAAVYRNDAGSYVQAYSLTGIAYGSTEWGDFDNDGLLDILLAGYGPAGPITKIYRQFPIGTFTEVTTAGLPGCFNGSASWGDYDHDGDLDVLLNGTNNLTPIAFTRVYRNNGPTNVFTDINAGLPALFLGSATWADLDNDGWLDILVTGSPTGSAATAVTRLYRNQADGTFALVPAPGLPGIIFGTLACGDADNDGDPDVVLTGQSPDGLLTRVYRNNGNGTFTGITTNLAGVAFSSVAWGDLDSDGWLDLVLIGTSGDVAEAVGHVYHNNGDDTFTLIPSAGLLPSFKGSLALGDMDKDGRLDIVNTGAGYNWRLYHNYWPDTNHPPAAPVNLVAQVLGTNALLSWWAAGDPDTPQPGLTYNLRVGTAPGASNIVSSAAAANGWRRIPGPGNRQQALSMELNGLRFGSNYYWSVQAVDPALAGSPFAAEGSFTITHAPASDAARLGSIMGSAAVIEATVYPNGLPTTAYIEWGATPSYGNSTAPQTMGAGLAPAPLRQTIQGLQAGRQYHYRVVTVNSTGTTYGTDHTFYVDPAVLLGDANGDAYISETELDTVLAGYYPTSPWLYLTNTAGLGGNLVTFALSNSTAGAYSVWMTTNLANWEYLGPAIPRYEFTDTNAPAIPQRYYRLSWP